MQFEETIRLQLAHFESGACGQHGTAENEVWIKALRWVLEDPDSELGWKLIHEYAALLPEEKRGEFVSAMRNAEGMFMRGLIPESLFRSLLKSVCEFYV